MNIKDNYIIMSDDTIETKSNIAKAKEYERICNKLGFIPSEYRAPATDTEDDNRVNPFSVLTIEEQDFLYHNGYLTHNKQIT